MLFLPSLAQDRKDTIKGCKKIHLSSAKKIS